MPAEATPLRLSQYGRIQTRSPLLLWPQPGIRPDGTARVLVGVTAISFHPGLHAICVTERAGEARLIHEDAARGLAGGAKRQSQEGMAESVEGDLLGVDHAAA